jgi:hypothetical protein
MSGRSGRIYMPRTEETKAGIRNYPLWLGDMLVYANKKMKKIEL